MPSYPTIILDKLFITTIEHDGEMLAGWKLASSYDHKWYEVFVSGKTRTWYGLPQKKYRLQMTKPESKLIYEGRKRDVLHQLLVHHVDTMM